MGCGANPSKGCALQLSRLELRQPGGSSPVDNCAEVVSSPAQHVGPDLPVHSSLPYVPVS